LDTSDIGTLTLSLDSPESNDKSSEGS
jgi:hypothetical protein